MEKDIDPKAFGRRLRERREELGLSQGQIGKELKKQGLRGYSQQNIGTLENGTVIKDPRRQAMDLAGPLFTTVEWLLHGKGQRSTGPRVMTPAEYSELPLDMQQAITEFAANLRPRRKKA